MFQVLQCATSSRRSAIAHICQVFVVLLLWANISLRCGTPNHECGTQERYAHSSHDKLKHLCLCVSSGFPAKDLQKLQYALDARAMDDPFICSSQLDATLLEVYVCICMLCVMSMRSLVLGKAFDWQKERSVEQVIQEREDMISQLELANEELWSSGKCHHWFRNSDETIRRVTEGVNGYLMEQLLWASHHRDAAAVELFKHGQWCM